MLDLLKILFSGFTWIIVAITCLINISRLYVDSLDTIGNIAFVILSVIILLLLIENFHLRINTRRKANFHDAMVSMKSCFAHLHDIERDSSKDNLKDRKNALILTCTNVATAMKTITKANCNVCIKFLEMPEGSNEINQIKVKTMCRDTLNDERNSTNFSQNDHLLIENTDFLEVYRNKNNLGFFISNRLPFLKNYRNSSFHHYGQKSSDNLSLYNFPKRYWQWKMPYKSTIVVPILPGKYNQELDNELLGFLCVDSVSLGVFKSNEDKQFLMGVSDGIYNNLNYLLT